jgi:hypothetical protein
MVAPAPRVKVQSRGRYRAAAGSLSKSTDVESARLELMSAGKSPMFAPGPTAFAICAARRWSQSLMDSAA